jgi:hypothetical protein
MSTQLLIFLPIVLSALIGLSALGLHLNTSTRIQTFCQRSLLQAQYENSLILSQLLKLNPQARKLRVEKNRAEANLKRALGSGRPELIAAAGTHLAWVTKQQLLFREGQKQLLLKAQQENLKSRRTLSSSLRKEQSLRLKMTQKPKKGLAVYPTPPGDLSPSYEVQQPFKNLQALRIEWQAQVPGLSKNWLKPLGLKEWKVKGVCSASLEKRRNRWNPVLNPAKS